MRYTVWLNSLSLADVNPAIYITDIAYQAQALRYTTNKLLGRDGSYAGKESLDSNMVSVSFMLRIYDTAQRQQALQDIVRWAIGGGWLATSDRPGQRLRVKATRLPGITSVMRWTDTLTLEFTAYDQPYWQDVTPQTATAQSQGSASLYNPGVRPAMVEATITAGDTLTSVTVTCGDTTIDLTGISLSSGDTVVISYTEDHHLLQIKKGTTSLLDKRTAASSDDLIAQPGYNTVTCSAGASCQFRVKGVWV